MTVRREKSLDKRVVGESWMLVKVGLEKKQEKEEEPDKKSPQRT